MSPPFDKLKLRRVLRRLRTLPVSGSGGAAAQEALDFLAMIAGLKPVYLGGRGNDDPEWIAEIRAIAKELALNVVDGGYWCADAAFSGLPDWYARAARESLAGYQAIYVARTKAHVVAVKAACATLAPSIEEEARLLGYPLCCVTEHYARSRRFHTLVLNIVTRAASGDIDRMSEMVAFQTIPDMTLPEQDEFARVLDMQPLPYTSALMCGRCHTSKTSPAARLARQYSELANAVDPAYFDAVLD
jgi:hypothetical protein